MAKRMYRITADVLIDDNNGDDVWIGNAIADAITTYQGMNRGEYAGVMVYPIEEHDQEAARIRETVEKEVREKVTRYNQIRSIVEGRGRVELGLSE